MLLKQKNKTEKGTDRCPECGNRVIIYSSDNGENVCAQCGLVVNAQIADTGPEWKAYTLEEKGERSRIGSPITALQTNKGLTTVIDKITRDSHGREVPIATRMQMLRLRKWQINTEYQSSDNKNLAKALSELDRIVDKLHISEDIQEEAANIYRKALKKHLVRGRSISSIVAAALYAACRVTSCPRSLKEIATVAMVGEREIARNYRLLLNELGLSMPIDLPKSYIAKIATKAKISGKAQLVAVNIMNKAREEKITAGKNPRGLAAAALYIAGTILGERKKQKLIAEAAGVTEVTLRNQYQCLKHLKNLQDIKNKGFLHGN
jgi:transcription initiation factor TFIIB